MNLLSGLRNGDNDNLVAVSFVHIGFLLAVLFVLAAWSMQENYANLSKLLGVVHCSRAGGAYYDMEIALENWQTAAILD